jgi:hypothetical protein
MGPWYLFWVIVSVLCDKYCLALTSALDFIFCAIALPMGDIFLMSTLLSEERYQHLRGKSPMSFVTAIKFGNPASGGETEDPSVSHVLIL